MSEFMHPPRALRVGFVGACVLGVGTSLACIACAESHPTARDFDGLDASPLPMIDAADSDPTGGDSGTRLEWRPVQVDDFAGITVTAMHAIGARLWIGGSRGFVIYAENGTIHRMGLAVRTYDTMVALWGTSPTDVWAAGGGNTLYQFQGAAGWVPRTFPSPESHAVAMAGTAQGMWVVLVQREEYPRYDLGSFGSHLWHKGAGPNFTLESSCVGPYGAGATGCPLYRAAWVAAENVPWFVGERGRITRGEPDGLTPDAGPTEFDSRTTADLNGVWGASGTDVWAVGTEGTLVHWNGEQWSTWESPTKVDLYSVWGRAHDDVWAVGALGTILHFDGAAWSRSGSGTSEPLYVVGGTSNEVLAGGKGVLLRLDEPSRGSQP